MKPKVLLAFAFLFLACSAASHAQTSFTCDNVNIKVIADKNKVYIGCSTSWPAAIPRVELFEYRDDKKTDPAHWITRVPAQRISVSILPNNILALNVEPSLAPQKRYLFVLKSDTTPDDMADLIVTLSTEAKGTVAASPAALDTGRKFTVTSDVAISQATVQQIYEKPEKNDTAEPKRLDANVRPVPSAEPRALGKASVILQHDVTIRSEKPVITVPGLVDVFGQPLKVENVIPLGAPPKGKDDASQFYQISHQAGRGAKPALALNVKANAFPGLRKSSFWEGDFLFQPDILVDIATNALAKKSDDTIHLGLIASRTQLRKIKDGSVSSGFYQGITYGGGAVYETDKEFDKSNLVGTLESHPLFRGFVKTREMRRYEAVQNPKYVEAATGTTPFGAGPKFKYQSLEDVPQSKFKAGYGFEFFGGLESGGSLRHQLFQSKAKKAQIAVPRYSIVRFRPRLHTFFEYDRFTFDVSEAFRILATPEYVGEEISDTLVRLRRVSGIQSYTEMTASYGLDSAKHLSLSITYKRGAQPPLFQHVNNLQSGFTIKY